MELYTFIDQYDDQQVAVFDDYFTEAHFQSWLDTQWDDEREEIEEGIRQLVFDDPDLTSTHSWPEMRRMLDS